MKKDKRDEKYAEQIRLEEEEAMKIYSNRSFSALCRLCYQQDKEIKTLVKENRELMDAERRNSCIENGYDPKKVKLI